MATRQIVDLRDSNNNAIYPKTHAKAVYFSNGTNVEEGYVKTMPSITGGTEKGHTGNGYARITKIA